MNTIASRAETPAKPLLRGVSHQYAFFVALVAGVVLVLRAQTAAGSVAAGVFGATLALLFGTSALYHRVQWDPAQRAVMRRLDHSAIFILIAGGYTPLFSLVAGPAGGHVALWVIWIGAMLGVAKSVFWSYAPKWVTALFGVALGWVVLGQVVARAAIVGWLPVEMLIGCGAIYSLGAVVYATRRPDPLPRVFGYHEVFHAIVIGASVCLYAHVVLVMRAVQG
jgi:hemolysin III